MEELYNQLINYFNKYLPRKIIHYLLDIIFRIFQTAILLLLFFRSYSLIYKRLSSHFYYLN